MMDASGINDSIKRLEEAVARIRGSFNGYNNFPDSVNGRLVNILGTDYTIQVESVDDNPKLENAIGLCELYSKKIVLSDLAEAEKDVMAVDDMEEFKKKVLRHEIIHAFFGESGLRSCSEYAEDEELVDWIAIQFPKMLKAFNEVGAL